MSNASFALLPDRGVLAVSGPDRRPFLQGLVSNDVDKIGPAAARYAALLTAQGKYLYDFIMIEVGESLWLDAEALRLSELKNRLSIYRLRAKVALAEKSERRRDEPGTRVLARALRKDSQATDLRVTLVGGEESAAGIASIARSASYVRSVPTSPTSSGA